MRRVLGISAVAALVIGALALPGGAAPAGGGGPKCPLKALDNADKPVEITFWHTMTRVPEETLVRLTDEFNASQSDVHVNLVNNTSYEDNLEKFRTGLGTDELPDMIQLGETSLQQVIDSQAVLPAQACVDADDYDLSDFVPRVTGYYTVEDELWAMPFNVSNPLLYYDRNAFSEAGLDPEQPPATLDEVREYSEQIKASGYPYGLALKVDAFFFEQLLGKADVPYVNNGNGRKERATAVNFDNKAGRDIFTWLSEMVSDGLAVTNPRTPTSEAINNFLAIGNEQAAMTIDTTAALGTISQILGQGDFANVDLGVGPMPGSSKGGTIVGGAALFIVNQSPPAKQAAAWEYAKFLNTPENVAEWSAATGYIPTRESAVELPVLQEQWAAEPAYRVAYDQLFGGKNDLATSGPVIGDYLGVREVIDDAQTRMFADGGNPKAALKRAKNEANAVIEEYNSRVGG